MNKTLKIILILIALILLSSFVFGGTEYITQFSGQTLPLNRTFSDDESVIYFVNHSKIYVSSATIEFKGYSDWGYFYQENYSSILTEGNCYNATNITDGVWDTWGSSTGGEGDECIIYLNYTKPVDVISLGNNVTYWQVKYGILESNLSLSNGSYPTYWSYQDDKLVMRIRMEHVTGDYNVEFQWYNGSNWKTMASGLNVQKVYEEAIWWRTKENASAFVSGLNISINDQSHYYNATEFNTSNTPTTVVLNATLINYILANNCNCQNCTNTTYHCSFALDFYSVTGGLLEISALNFTIQSEVDNCSGSSLGIPSNATALNISFYDHNDAAKIIDYKATTNYPIDTLSSDYSTDQPFIKFVQYCIYPNWAKLVVDQQNRWYDSGNDIFYDYFFFQNEFNNNTQALSLYTQNGTVQVLFTVQDTNTDPLSSVYIHILKYDVGTGSYTVQEILKTDSQGQAIGNIILNNVFYNFLLYYNGELVYTEQAVRLIDTTRTFTIDLEGVGWIDDFEVAFDVNYNLYFNNASKNFVFTWSDPTSASHFGCLKVDVTNDSGKFTLSDTCIESASGTIVYPVASYNGTTFTATGYLKFDVNIVLKVIQQVFAASRAFFYREMPLFSLFISVIIMIALFCIGLPHPAIALSLMGMGMIITYILGLFTVTPIFLGGIIFLIVLQMYLISKK